MNSSDRKLLGIIALFGLLFLAVPPLVYNATRAWKAETEKLRDGLKQERQKTDLLERQVAVFRKQLIAIHGTSAAEGTTEGAAGGSEAADLVQSGAGAVAAGAFNPATLALAGADCQTIIDEIAKLQATLDEQTAKKQHCDDVRKLLSLQRVDADAQRKLSEVNLKTVTQERDSLFADLQMLEKDRTIRFGQVIGVHDAQGTVQSGGLQDELNKTIAELEKLQPVREQLLADAENYRGILTKAGIDAAVYADQPLPLDARVTKVADTTTGRLVSISVGADQGLRRGHALDAYRVAGTSASYLGRVEVVEAQRDQAVCKVLPNFQRGVIQEGDRVSSQLQ